MRPLLICLIAVVLFAAALAPSAGAHNARILLLDAQAAANRGQDQEAMILLDQVIAADELSDELRSVAFVKRGNIQFRKKRFPLAQEDFGRALALDPDSEQALRGSCFALLQMRKMELAQQICYKAAQVAAEDNKAEAADILGYSALMRRDYVTALRELDTAIQADPTYAPAYLHRGMVYQAQKQEVLARADFLKARELWPQDPEIEAALRQLGLIF